ncbi:hypothetical protein [Pseudomonas aeruginosa]|uniref:hypothetical protein n=1 Tax=Pseudomonas aeruginosa TaxID=287 RepID=UPI002A6B8CBE|nr:hypothetical protein [Pseudomonas aeruginosa]MDY1103286.1 hypothetical protein [Pseudomonas aeruginosa]
MKAGEFLFWAAGGIVLAVALLSLAIAGWFFEMPARDLFAFIACVVMFPLAGNIRSNLKGWKRLRNE